jgi:hypothetical protein
MKANINDRRSLEQAYPPDAYASDAAQNGRSASEVTSGVRILSGPDGAGEFEIERAAQQVGEATSPAFLAPYRRVESADPGAEPSLPKDYDSFLDDVVAAAQRFGFEAEKSPGRNEPRLHGLRQ